MILAFVVCIGDIYFDSVTENTDGDRRGQSSMGNTMSNFEKVQAFYSAWAAGDLDGSLAQCTDDLVWDNVPIKPFEGKERVRGFLEKFGRGMSNVSYEIKQHFEQDKFVVIEGVEKYDKDGHSVAVPYMAVFAFREGKISEMRDYFDLGTVERQLGLRE